MPYRLATPQKLLLLKLCSWSSVAGLKTRAGVESAFERSPSRVWTYPLACKYAYCTLAGGSERSIQRRFIDAIGREVIPLCRNACAYPLNICSLFKGAKYTSASPRKVCISITRQPLQSLFNCRKKAFSHRLAVVAATPFEEVR